jgi:hypothetical protein
MKPFRRSRDYDGKFALTTLQNPFLDVTPRPQPTFTETKRTESPAQPLIEANVAATPIEVLDPAPAITPAPEFTEQPQTETRPEAAPASTEATAAIPATETLATETPVVKTETRAKPSTNRKARAKMPRPTTTASFFPEPEESELERHRRKCAVCNHPYRQALEEDFLNWGDVAHLTKVFEIKDSRGVYRHAHATGLFERRRQNVRFAAECIVEQVARVKVSNPESILNAIRTITRLNDRGQWHEPVSHVVVSSGGRIDTPAHQNLNSPEPQNSNRQFSDHLARLENGPK